MREESMKKNSWLFALLLLVSFGVVALPGAVRAQWFDDDDDDYYYYYYYDEDEFDDFADFDEEAYGALGRLEDATVGINNRDGRFSLAATPAALFMQIAEMERDNAIMRLRIERERLNLDLERQRAEMQQVGLALEEERAARARRIAEEEAIAEEEIWMRQIEAERAPAEIDRQQQENELNRRVLDRITSADLSDPAQVSAIAQLLAFAPGAATTLPAAVRDQIISTRDARVERDYEPEMPAPAPRPVGFDERFTIRSIAGAGGRFTANVENNDTSATMRLRQGSNLEGWMVSDITRSAVVFRRGAEMQILHMN